MVTDAAAEAPILWPPDAKSWLIGKDSDNGKNWGQEEKVATEDEMVGWDHRLNRHESGRLREIVKDREARSAAVHGVSRVGHDWATKQPHDPVIQPLGLYAKENRKFKRHPYSKELPKEPGIPTYPSLCKNEIIEDHLLQSTGNATQNLYKKEVSKSWCMYNWIPLRYTETTTAL